MTRKIRYKPISKELEAIVKPSDGQATRASVGMEGAVGEFYYISVNDLVRFRHQARQDFNEEEINELANSIKEYGIRQPLTVFKNEEGKYEVVSGERRLRAAKIAGLEKVPCIILKDSTEADAIALIENIHRKDLHPVELGIIYKKLLEKGVFKNQEDLAQKTSVSKSRISEYLKYTRIPYDIQLHIINNKIESRDKLRNIVQACDVDDSDKARVILGMLKEEKKSFSVLRVVFNNGNIKTQESGIRKLSISERAELKVYLQQLMSKI